MIVFLKKHVAQVSSNLGSGISPAMGRKVYLPIHEWLKLVGFHVGKYTSPMDTIWVMIHQVGSICSIGHATNVRIIPQVNGGK